MVLDMLYEGPDLKMLFRFSGLFSQNLALTNSNTYRMRKAFDSILSLFFPRPSNISNDKKLIYPYTGI